MNINWEFIFSGAHAALTPIIAVIATYIAWQQWKGSELRLKLDRYETRLKVYQEVQGYLAVVFQKSNVTVNDIRQLRVGTAEARFQFGDEIANYVDDLVKRGVKLASAKAEYRDMTQEIPPGYDHKKVCDAMHEEIWWFNEQFDKAQEKFRKYLDVA